MIQASKIQETATALSPQQVRQRPLWQTLEFLLVSALVLLMLELILRVADVPAQPRYQFDPVMGWALCPNVHWRTLPEGTGLVTINSMGMHDLERSVQKPEGVFRIAVLGCSLTEAAQVSAKDTFCSELEQRLNSHHYKQRFEVLNFGVLGYSVGQQYLWLKQSVFKFKPDLVLLTVSSHIIKRQANLFCAPQPIFTAGSQGELLVDNRVLKEWLSSPIGRFSTISRSLSLHSRVIHALIRLVTPEITARDTPKRWESLISLTYPDAYEDLKTTKADSQLAEMTAKTLPPDLLLRYGNKVVAATLEQCDRECLSHNCRLAVITLPDSAGTAQQDQLDYVRDCATKLSITYHDLNPFFRQLDKSPHQPFVFALHYTPQGHRAIAEQLAAFLQQTELLN